MNTKTLLAFCCLLAAAQARPTPPSSGCSLSCSGRNFWTGYESGTTLKYSFEQKVELSSSLNRQKSVVMQVTGKANVEVHGDCEMVLTVDVQSSKSSKSPSEATDLESKTLPSSMVDALKEPLRFAFQNGRIEAMCPGSSETRASLNFKRGLLSQLHLSIDRPDQEARVREDDVLGNCWTVYKRLGDNKLEKTKDLSSCTSNFEVFPRQGVKYEAPQSNEQWPTVVQGKLKCTIELEGESMIIKENSCVEDRVLDNNVGEKGRGESVKVTTKLKMEQKLSSVGSALFAVIDRSDLKHQHKTGDSCHDSKVWFEEDIFHSGNECLEKKLPATGTASSDFKELAKTTIEELCEETKPDKMLNSTAAKYADLVKYMRGITSQEDFTALFNWVKNGYCRDNSMLQAVVYSAIPSVGTKQSVKVMLDQLKDADGMSADKNTANWLANGIAMMPHPTPEIISEVLEFTKQVEEDSMLIISKEQPLALAAITGRYCTINTNCETNEAVAAVLQFFSNSIGTNCSNLEEKDLEFPTKEFDYAFASLLSIGNIGRAAGGASSIIGCAENSKLSLAHRIFALHSLRRFPSLSKKQKMRLGELIKSKELDSELRITAYLAVARYADISFWSDKRVLKQLSDFMQDEQEDKQVQRFIYSHLSQWMARQKRSTDSYTVSNILRQYEKILKYFSLSDLQTSNYWRRVFKNKSPKSKVELESNVIYSSKSMLPRFVNFNVTMESPLSGEAVNVFEAGMRMEGMEGIMEQVFNTLSQASSSDELVRKRRQASSSPELTEEQKQYNQEPTRQRFDFFTRKNGMELMHTNFGKDILGVVPQLMKTTDFDNVKGLAAEQLGIANFSTVAQSAGTPMESSLSMPTISGFPILLKKEIHYLSNIDFKQNFDMPSMMQQMNMGLELQPTVSVHMARTVTVDSGFERAGVRSRTSGLSSVGVKLSMVGNFSNPDDILFSYKVDPLKKQQKILELKTDIVFMQHRGPSNVVESPVVSPSQMTSVTQKCFTPATVKLFGRRLCLETNFERTNRPMAFVRQNPGTFRLFIDKDDSFGLYEATFKFKKEGRNYDVLAVLGDQKSPERHAKFQFLLIRTPSSRKIVVEMANPVLPIKWVSERNASGDGYDVTVDLKFGSTDYAFRGKKSKDPEGGWKLDGNFFRKDKERQKMNIVTKFETYGLLRFLPLFRFDFTATTPSDDKLTFNHLLSYKSGKFEASMLASHEKSGSVVTSVKSRLQCIRMQREAAGRTRVILYDTEVVNKNGKNFQHSFSAKVDRKPKDTPNLWQSGLTVNHTFKYGVSKEKSVLDFEVMAQLEELIKPKELYKATGSGSLKYQSDSGPKTATLTNLRLILGEDDVIDNHFNTKTFLLEYATDLDGSQSNALVAVQALPFSMWRRDNQCLYFKVKASKTTGADSKNYALELRHTAGLGPEAGDSPVSTLLQVAKLIYANQVLLDATHKFYPMEISYEDALFTFGHFVNVTTYDGQSYYIRNEYSTGKGPVAINTIAMVNQEKVLAVNQSLSVDSPAMWEYKLNYWIPSSTGSLSSYSKDYNFRETKTKAWEISQYLRRVPTDGFNFRRFASLLKQYFYSIKKENGFSLDTPSQKVKVTNYVDTTVTNGVALNFTRSYTKYGRSRSMSSVLYKELEKSESRYRRAYRLIVGIDSKKRTYKTEVICTKTPNTRVQMSLSQSTSGYRSNYGDFNITSVAEFVRQYQREGQVALLSNTSITIMNLRNTLVEVETKLKVVTDTKLKKWTNPALNVSLDVSSSTGETMNAVYGLTYVKSGSDGETGKSRGDSLSSELSISNTFSAIPFQSYSGITIISRKPEEPFNFVFKKTLDESDVINFQTTLNNQMLYIGMKSDVLPAKEVSYRGQYNEESDGFKSYLSQIRFNVLSWDLNVKDTGRFKTSGRSEKRLFSIEYSGSLEFSGLEKLIGQEIQMDRLNYSGVLEAMTTGEFKSIFRFTKVQGAIPETLGLFSTQYNYWPFIISAQIYTPFWNIDNYAFNISAVEKGQGNVLKFKAWIASPRKQSSLKYWHKLTQYPQWFNATAVATLQSEHLSFLNYQKIKSRVVVTGNDFMNHTVSLNMTTPFRAFQLMQWDIVHQAKKQSAVITMKMNDRQEEVMTWDRIVRVGADGTSNGNFTFYINSINQMTAGFVNVGCEGYFVSGSDYLWGVRLIKDNERRSAVDLLWIKSGKSYPQLSGLSVPNANLGFQVQTTLGSSPYELYLLRSGTVEKTKWQMYYKGENEVKTELELSNGKVTSGSGTAFGKSVTFSSPSDGIIDVTAASVDGTNKITWNSEMDDGKLKSLQLKFSFGDKESCLGYKKEGQKLDVQYGSCTAPNTLTVTCSASNIWNPKQAILKFNAQHQTVPASNEFFHLLPGVSLPLMASSQPFSILMDIDNTRLVGNMTCNFPGVPFEFSQEFDFGQFPSAIKFKRIVKAYVGPKQYEETIIVNYDMSVPTLDVSLGTKGAYKIIMTMEKFSIEVPQVFTAGVEYTTEDSTGKKMIEMKGEWRPKPDSQPCVLKLWRINIEGGIRYALQFVQHTGKELSISSDVTNFKFTSTEFSMDVKTAITSTIIETLRSANSQLGISFVKDAVNENYTLTYKESFSAGGSVYYDMESLFKGQQRWFPSTLKIAFLRGYMESEFSYNFNQEYDSESYLRWSRSKLGENRNNYLAEYRTRDVSVHVGKFWRDFSLEISSPRRQIYLSESCQVLANGTVQTEVQAYLNKRNSEGITAVFTKDFTKPDVYKRGLQLTLPTRKVGYDRALKLDGDKLEYKMTFFWDMHSAMQKNVTVHFKRETATRLRDNYYSYSHTLSMAAPFLKNNVTKSLSYEIDDRSVLLSMNYTIHSVDSIMFKLDGKKYWDSNRLAYQKVVMLQFRQQKGDVKADVNINIDSMSLSRSKTYSPDKYMTVFNIYTVIPSQSVDSHIRIRSVPFEEFTYACNHGATFSFRYYRGYERSRLSLFVSNSKKEAGQLTMVRDWLMSTWEATLDTGTGYMDPKSKLSFPFYKPTTVKIKATAGVSTNSKKVYFGVVNGAMGVKSSINLWKPSTVPDDLDFFFVGVKFRKDSTMNYVSHWRIRQRTMKSPFTSIKEVLIDPWAKARSLPFSTGTINKLLRPVSKSKSDNIDTDVVLDLLTSISSNDIDSLKRWAAKAKENNEFLSNTIGKYLVSGFYIVKDCLESWAASVRAMSYTDALPSDLGIMSGISRLSDSISGALSSIPISSLWSSGLSTMKGASDMFSYYFSSYVDSLDSSIRERISSLTGGRGSSILDMLYNAVSSVYPVRQLCKKLGIIVKQYFVGLWTADTELAAQTGKAMEPYIINTLSEIPKVYDFLDNIAYEIDMWGVYFRSLLKSAARKNAGEMQERMIGRSVFKKNLAKSFGLLLAGDYSGAIRKFFNTKANVVHVWRVTCDQACLDSGSFAAINGSLYIPFNAMSIIIKSPRFNRLRPGFGRGSGVWNKLNMIGSKLRSAAEESGIFVGLRRLMTPGHRVASASGDYITTFGGMRTLRNLSPCRYLLAHDFLNSDFSIYQTYTWNGRRQRGDLLVRFFGLRAVITNRNELKLDGAAVKLPVTREIGEQTVEASGTASSIVVKFHSEMRSAVEVRCDKPSNSCNVQVHPLYHGRVNGAFGSNDGNAGNDLHANSQSEHMRLWTVDSCIMS